MNRFPSRLTAASRSRFLSRSGQSLVEFALVALVLYLLLAAILTFGHALYVAQGLQGAADLAAREISRTPLPPTSTLEQALQDPTVVDQIYDPSLLVFDRSNLTSGVSFFEDIVPTWPLLNQQLATLMITDGDFIRYPGALLSDSSTPTEFTIEIPLIERDSEGVETIRMIPVVEEIRESTTPSPFDVNSPQRGIVALRINYPFQSASMSSFRRDESDPEFPFESTIGRRVIVDQDPESDDPIVFGTNSGDLGLGAQAAFGEVVRPFRRVISAQAIYRREVFQ